MNNEQGMSPTLAPFSLPSWAPALCPVCDAPRSAHKLTRTAERGGGWAEEATYACDGVHNPDASATYAKGTLLRFTWGDGWPATSAVLRSCPKAHALAVRRKAAIEGAANNLVREL